MRAKSPLITASILAFGLVASAMPAQAACKKMGFLVNDYGKDGPTKDAKDLLDKEIAKWAAENGIAKYTVSKKDVKCELFLDVLLFDEHTCTASAQVCWGEAAAPSSGSKPASASNKKKSEAPAVETGAISTETPAAPEAAPAEPAEAPPAPEQKSEAPAAPAESDAAERAAAAAERAAAAAERAAAAAEKAAMNTPSNEAPARQMAPSTTE